MMKIPGGMHLWVHNIANQKLSSRVGDNPRKSAGVRNKVTINSIRLHTEVHRVGEEQHTTQVTCKVIHRIRPSHVTIVAKKVITAEIEISLTASKGCLSTFNAGDITRCTECQV